MNNAKRFLAFMFFTFLRIGFLVQWKNGRVKTLRATRLVAEPDLGTARSAKNTKTLTADGHG